MRDRKNGNSDTERPDTLKELKKDIEGIKESKKTSRINKTKTVLKQNKYTLLLIGVISGIAIYFYTGGEIPEWAIFTLIGAILSVVVTYPYVDKAVNWLITDNRKPIVEIPDSMDEIHIYDVPEKEIPNIEVVEGNLFEVDTTEGKGYQVAEFEKVDNEGEIVYTAKASWEGSISNYERKQKYAFIEENREMLEPKAKKWRNFKFKKQLIVKRITDIIINKYAKQFEGVMHEEDINREIERLVNDLETQEEQNEQNKEITVEDIEEIKEIASNGENNGT